MSEEPKLPFTEDEWARACVQIVTEMTEFPRPSRLGVFEDKGDHGDGWGTGSYLELDGRPFILTNEHVAVIRERDRRLIHQFQGTEDLRLIHGDHVAMPWPHDLAILPVDEQAWSSVSHGSKAISVDQIAMAHAPVIGEVLTLVGFAGERTGFFFGQLASEATCYSARETPLPSDDDRFSSRFHFAIDYRPDKAEKVIGTSNLPLPPGLSGSTVWNTRYVEAKMQDVPWTPDMARVTGVVWGWPRSDAFLVATRAEHVRSFLLGASSVLKETPGKSSLSPM